MVQFPEIIKYDNLELRRLYPTYENAEMIFKVIDKNREFFQKWLPWVDSIKTPEDDLAALEKLGTDNRWFIFEKGTLVGQIGFFIPPTEAKTLGLGYWLDKDATGRGIITRAVRLLENLVFGDEHCEYNRIRIHCDALNIASSNIPKKLGYKQEGILRQVRAYNDGSLGDSIVWSKLKSEWEKEDKNA